MSQTDGLTVNELIELGNMSELSISNMDRKFTKMRTLKDNYGNALGVVVIDEYGDIYNVTNHNGETCLIEQNTVAAVPERVGSIQFTGESEWVTIGTGEISITA